ncbi:Protein-L-isoaspartate O-methyltransferase domain-containing protein 1 [Bulinus truncatus]|nr:Protein-L-isoaspartate O-methyltransferase domain-containing protein 1 [Bulinus truncatus]
MGGAVSSGQDNDELIDNLKDAEYIKTEEVERVFRIVDRAHYYLKECRENAYKDLAWKSGTLHLSAPCIYSEVMEALELKLGLSFLNLGSGTGYLNTMVGLMIGPYGINHGIELHPENVAYAMEKLESFIKCSKRFDDIELCVPQFVVGNCLNLAPENRLYDRVYCGAACPPELKDTIQNMVKVNGILVIPVGDQLLKIKRISETEFTSDNVLPVSFASLVQPGPGQKDVQSILLPEVNPLTLQCMCRITIRNAIRATYNFPIPASSTSKSKKRKHIRSGRLLGLNDERYSLDLLPTPGGLMIMEAFSDDDERDQEFSETSDDDIVEMQYHSGEHQRSKERSLLTEHKEEGHDVDSDISDETASSAATSVPKDVNGNKDSDNLDERNESKSADCSKPLMVNDEDHEYTNEIEQKGLSDFSKNKSKRNKGKSKGDMSYGVRCYTYNNPYERITDRILNIMGTDKDDQSTSTSSKTVSSNNRSISQSSDDDVSLPKLVSGTQTIHMASMPGSSTQPCPITASYSTSADTSETSGFGSLGDDTLHVGSHQSAPGSFKDDIYLSPSDSRVPDSKTKEETDGDDSLDPGWMDIDDNEDIQYSEKKKASGKPADNGKDEEKQCTDAEDCKDTGDQTSLILKDIVWLS